jgi:hypothetical protein
MSRVMNAAGGRQPAGMVMTPKQSTNILIIRFFTV